MELSPAEIELVKLDPILGELITRQGHIEPRSPSGYFAALVGSIVSQQISVKAASAIHNRLTISTSMLPEKILQLSDEQVRSIGLSGQKIRYLRDLAEHFIDSPKVFDHLDQLSDQEVIIELTRIKGIGIWTAQMFLLFTLGRPDVFAPGDRGLQLAIERLYSLKPLPTLAELEKLSLGWSPYRSIACRHLWLSLGN